MFYIKTNDIIQYIENFISGNKNIFCDDENNIFIMGQQKIGYYNVSLKIKTIMANIINHEIQFIKEYEEFSANEENLSISHLKDNILLLWNNYIYISKEI